MSHPDFPPHLTDKLNVKDALKVLGFVELPSNGCYFQRWGIVEFTACESMFGWSLIRSYTKRTESAPKAMREFGSPYEIKMGGEIAPVDLMAIIYPIWAEAYPGKEPEDVFLIWGKEWLDYQNDVKKLIPPMPTIWADREFLRYCLTYIERQHDWIDEDYPIRFSQSVGQLRINAKDTEIYCPARGNWVGESIVSAKELFRRIPKRFVGYFVTLKIMGDKLMIDTRVIPAKWVDIN